MSAKIFPHIYLRQEIRNDVADFALDGLQNKLSVREHLTAIPAESDLAREVNRAREVLVIKSRHGGWRGENKQCGFGL
jgi:hypothetical protein